MNDFFNQIILPVGMVTALGKNNLFNFRIKNPWLHYSYIDSVVNAKHNDQLIVAIYTTFNFWN